MEWIAVSHFPLDEDLSHFAQGLQQRGVPHRFTEQDGRQYLWVSDQRLAGELQNLFQQNPLWYRNLSSLESDFITEGADSSGALGAALLGVIRYPVTLMFILLGCLGALLVEYDKTGEWLHWLTFQDFVVSGNRVGFYSLSSSLEQGQYWRLLTPVFLHFSIFHILFNAMWMWEFGRRVEPVSRSWHYLLLVVVIAVISNACQYYWEGPSLFGGLSGLLYGLLGFIWMRQRFAPGSIEPVPSGVLIFMLVWLVACMTGVVGFIMSSQIANAAHLGGLLAGMVLGFITANRQA